MKVLVIGGGGREHAILESLANSPKVSQVFVISGNEAPGFLCVGNSKIFNLTNISLIAPFSDLIAKAIELEIDLVVPGPEGPLVDGINDFLRKVGILCFGPSKAASQLEGSKAFSKDFMKRNGIPTAEYKVFNDFNQAKKFLEINFDLNKKYVIKASGLAAGKGVILPTTLTEALTGLTSLMLTGTFGTAGSQVVIEELLEGQEVSCLAFCDGYTVVPMPGAQDHKRVGDGDTGLNTGGMGCYAPAPVYGEKERKMVIRDVLQATVDAMRHEGTPFVGVLYAGIMLTKEGPKVLEYNVRFGDPETQVLLPLLATPLFDILHCASRGCLDSIKVEWRKGYACAVVAAAGGYPGSYQRGHAITFNHNQNSLDSPKIFHAGTIFRKGGELATNGGRVLAVVGVADDLPVAIKLAYDGIEKVGFEGMHYRKDIGQKALVHLESVSKKNTTYAETGVDITTGNLLVETIKPYVKKTMRAGADAELGGFGGLFDLKQVGYKDAILVSGTDGVGTKLKIAQSVGIHDSIGIDLVAMSVNDVLVQVKVAAEVVKGIAMGCVESGCALIGGETAEMPGIYRPGEYDLAGFVVGAVERDMILPRLEEIKQGDVLLGLASSGVHSNGFSLVRHVIDQLGLEYSSQCPFETDLPCTLGEALLKPTRLYVKCLLPVLKRSLVKSMVHVTGGGLLENIPRSIPQHLGVRVMAGTWPFLNVFRWVKKAGNIEDHEMARTFNCGIGMVLVVERGNVDEIRRILAENEEDDVYTIGEVVPLLGLQVPEGERVAVVDMKTKWN